MVISGAGPTLLALVDAAHSAGVETAMGRLGIMRERPGAILSIDLQGATKGDSFDILPVKNSAF